MKEVGVLKTSSVASVKVISSNISLVQFFLLSAIRSKVCVRMNLLVI